MKTDKKRYLCFILILLTAGVIGVQPAAADQVPIAKASVYKFDFGPGAVAEGYTPVLPTAVYSSQTGYGFEPPAAVLAVDRGTADMLQSDFVTGQDPFLFSVRLPEGNYKVTMTFGDSEGDSAATVKAEMRRLMLENVKTEKGRYATRSIIVNIRTPEIAGGGQVRLKDREKANEVIAWDDKLTLEFNGSRPCLCSMQIERADGMPTVYLLGDSTVCDQPLEPWNSWGQMLPRFFRPELAVANHAQSGESIRSSLSAGRFNKVWGTMKPGDYLFLQFGHNDMKSRSPNALETYKADLITIIAETKKRGATPVLVTSMERKEGLHHDTLGGYPKAVRQAATETQSALIDLHAMSKVLYQAMGTDLDKAFQDGTHHTSYGSYELARCVIQNIKNSRLDLAWYIADDFGSYDPAHPALFQHFTVPSSPMHTADKPLGS